MAGREARRSLHRRDARPRRRPRQVHACGGRLARDYSDHAIPTRRDKLRERRDRTDDRIV